MGQGEDGDIVYGSQGAKAQPGWPACSQAGAEAVTEVSLGLQRPLRGIQPRFWASAPSSVKC